MTGRPTFGDFLQEARRHLETSAVPDETAAQEDLDEVISALSRLVAVMGRYTQDLTATFPELSPNAQPVLSPWAEASFQAREALAGSARFLALRGLSAGRSAAASPGPRARRLTAAAASLRLGRDLLHTHFAPGPDGGRRQRSEWAVVITSDAVHRALLAELASFARAAADHGSELALSRFAGVTGERHARRRLNSACQWLWVLAASVRAAQHREPRGSAGGEVLAAIPVNTLPARPVLRGGEPVAALCEGAITSAERVRHLAWLAADHVAASRNVTIASLRQVAENSTVTSHNCAGLLDILAVRTAQAGYGKASGRLAAAAGAARRARDTWLGAAREVTRIRTVTPGPASATAAEASDLAAWTGRLAYADPQWSPADGPDRPTRPPETIGMEDLGQVVAAAHHACETLVGLAAAEHEQIRTAAQAGRILVPTRSLPDEYDIPYPFAQAPHHRMAVLLGRYEEAAHASRYAADTVGEAAQIVRGPSRTLTLARSAVTGRADPVPNAADDARRRPAEVNGGARAGLPGPVETLLLDLGVTDPRLLTRGAEVDRDAECLIIDAAAATQAGQRPRWPNGLSRSAGTAALVNHALQSEDPRAVALLRPPIRAQREPPEREP